ncbi:MAG TPA: hypothetical protein VFS43_38315 [Polyangiaceae bacterium]|nr:hypothetical protein [Polyangiaceae bacterium]
MAAAPSLRLAPPSPGDAPAPPPESLSAFAQRLDDLETTERYERLSTWAKYYDGKQYDERPYDENGCVPGSFGLHGGPEGWVPWGQRRIRSVHNLARDVARRLAEWSVGGTSWCELAVPGDDDATEWLEGLVDESRFWSACVEAAKEMNGCGGAVVSAAWRRGRVAWEVHRPQFCWVLSWADRRELVPREVVKVFRLPDPYKPASNGYRYGPDDGPFLLRYWSGRALLPSGAYDPASPPGIEAYFRAEKDRQGKWRLYAEGPAVAHGSDRCPVFWVPNTKPREECGPDGEPAFAGAEGKIDEVNELLQAAGNTSKRNADDTVVLKMDPAQAPGLLRKGALGVIVSPGGADYLSQDGSSAKAMTELAGEVEDRFYRLCGVVKASLKDLASQTSGEALRRIYAEQISRAGDVRDAIERWLVAPGCAWMLRTSRAFVAAGVPVVMPPVEEEGEGEETTTRPRLPGSAEAVEVTWPDPFPPTMADLESASKAAMQATNARAMSQETAVRVLVKAGAPVASVEAELERIRQDADEKAEQAAKGLGLAAEATAPFKDKAGPVDG